MTIEADVQGYGRTPGKEREDRIEACKTFVEEVKLLVTLASAFLLAPTAVQIFLSLPVDGWIVAAQILFIVSVLGGYLALAAVAGTQHKGHFNVYAPEPTWAGRLQFCSYVIGLVFFLTWLLTKPQVWTHAPQKQVQPVAVQTTAQPSSIASPPRDHSGAAPGPAQSPAKRQKPPRVKTPTKTPAVKTTPNYFPAQNSVLG